MKISLFVAALWLGLAVGAAPASPAVQSLAGPWRFQLDPRQEGEKAGWFKAPLADTIRLPGTTDENRKGTRNTRTNFTSHLSRVYPYSGPAWYQREIEVPSAWKDQRLTLLLERTKMTRVWVDEQMIGAGDSLAAPQVFDLSSALTPGRHRLTVCVDNKKRPPVNGGHQLSEDTQTDWNGLLGRLELRATDRVWLEDVQVHPDAQARRIKVRMTLGNESGRDVSGTVELSARSWNGARRHAVAPMTVKFATAGAVLEADYDLGPEALLWDEFSPTLYQLSVKLKASSGSRLFTDSREVDFGLREFSTQGTQFAVNGRKTFLRGKHEACVFPLTGHPPMNADGWLRVFKIARSYGINHYRFHSWTPPEAAFAAADQAGIYLQPELFNFGGDLSKNPAGAEYCRAEGKRILRAFGNHPSFVMFALGNEMGSGYDVRGAIVKEFRQFDPRHLYAQASNYDFWQLKFAESDDYWTTFRTRRGLEGNVRGSYAHADAPLGHVQTGPPAPLHNYSGAMAGVAVPVIGHEVGQYQVYPNFKEISKYTGVLRAWNFEVFRDRLRARGMLDQDDDFCRASGALAVINYREEIEAALRTPGFGGFQLLDLQDFPGQGTALVGILDAFMDSKGLIEPERWREFCSPTVPLALLPQYTWTTAQTISAAIKVAHYGPETLRGVFLSWSLSDGGRKLASGRLGPRDIPQGTLADVGEISASLGGAAAPRALELLLRIENTPWQNRYPLWVYPESSVTLQTNSQAPSPLTLSPREREQHRAVGVEPPTSESATDGPRVLPLPKGLEPLGKRRKEFAEGKGPAGAERAGASESLGRGEGEPNSQLHGNGLTATVTRRVLDEEALGILARGGRVLLLPEPAHLAQAIPGFFASDFWCYPMFKRGGPPGTLGLLAQPKHPALARFPTESHSDWQWFHLVTNSAAIILDDAPAGFRPIVQVIDNFDADRNHKLGMIFETRVGPGRLLVCASDLPSMLDRPEARQLLASLLEYANSSHFKPNQEIPPETLRKILARAPVNLALHKPATASSSQSEAYGPSRANDGDSNTRWCAATNTLGQWWQVDLLKPSDLTGCEQRWEFDKRLYQYLVEGSADGSAWTILSDQRQNQQTARTQKLSFAAKSIRYVRITVTGLQTTAPQWASLAEVKVFGVE